MPRPSTFLFPINSNTCGCLGKFPACPSYLYTVNGPALPMHHRDPFDRVLVAQAQAEGPIIVTRDLHIPRYSVLKLAA